MKIALIALVKNSGHKLFEFINHYILEGVNNFILIVDSPADEFYESNSNFLKKLIKAGIITIKKTKKKLPADKYNEQLDFVKKFDWLIVCNLNEFIFSVPKDSTIKSLLMYDKYFLDCNYIRIPSKVFFCNSDFKSESVINKNILTHKSNFDHTSSSNSYTYIIKPDNVNFFEPHECITNSNKSKILPSCHNQLIQNNHYTNQMSESVDSNFFYECNILKNKRCNLIKIIENENEIVPSINLDSSFLKKKKKVIKLKIHCGLCNRLQTIFFYLNRLKEDEILVVIWNWSDKGNCNWNDLNSNGNFYDYFSHINNLYFIKDNENKQKYKFPINYYGNGFNLNKSRNKWKTKNNYDKLKLNSYYSKILENERNKLKNEYIAIHVRRTDIKDIYDAHKVKFDQSYDIYDKFINSSNIKNLYIATDNQETYQYFSSKYKKSHLINNNVTFLDTEKRRKTSLSDSIIDLFMCIYSNKFLGTKLSSFTEFILNNRMGM